MVVDLPGVGHGTINNISLPIQAFEPLAPGLEVDELPEHKVVHVEKRVKIRLVAQQRVGVKHANQDLCLLPELLFGRFRRTFHRRVRIDSTELGVDANRCTVIADRLHHVPELCPVDPEHVRRVQQKPYQLHVMARGSLIQWSLPRLVHRVLPPLRGEDNPGKRGPIVRKMYIAETTSGVDHSAPDQIDHFD